MRQLRIIDYVQSQRTAKTSNMESLMSNGFIEKYSATPMDSFKGDLFLCHNFNFNNFMEKKPCTKFCRFDQFS